ncbi:MAG: 30S ribosomal protein S20 [Ardenticatenaceae bacterium]
MANIKSAKKRIRQNEKRRLRNRHYIGASRKAVKNARSLIDGGDVTGAEEAIREACSKLDRAAIKGIIHKNNASRRKSRLMKAYHRARAEAPAA